jgi:hypothetical protein
VPLRGSQGAAARQWRSAGSASGLAPGSRGQGRPREGRGGERREEREEREGEKEKCRGGGGCTGEWRRTAGSRENGG